MLGQSNMEFMLRQTITGKKDIPQAADEQLRLYDMKALAHGRSAMGRFRSRFLESSSIL